MKTFHNSTLIVYYQMGMLHKGDLDFCLECWSVDTKRTAWLEDMCACIPPCSQLEASGIWGSCPVHSQQLTTWPLIYHAVIMTEMFHWSSRVPAWNVTRPHFENTWLSYGTYDTDCKLLYFVPAWNFTRHYFENTWLSVRRHSKFLPIDQRRSKLKRWN